MISLEQYYTDYNTKADRRKLYPSEYTDQINQNAILLLQKVNALLEELGIDQSDVTSGWRPDSLNKTISNAAKRSYHMLGMAVDILDNKNQDLGKLVASRPDLLRKYGLWIEDLGATIGKNTNWVHLDYGNRADRQSRMFKP